MFLTSCRWRISGRCVLTRSITNNNRTSSFNKSVSTIPLDFMDNRSIHIGARMFHDIMEISLSVFGIRNVCNKTSVYSTKLSTRLSWYQSRDIMTFVHAPAYATADDILSQPHLPTELRIGTGASLAARQPGFEPGSYAWNTRNNIHPNPRL